MGQEQEVMEEMGASASPTVPLGLRPEPLSSQGLGHSASVSLREQAARLAFGLLWHMQIDRNDPNLCLASDARRALAEVLTTDERADGIARAKACDARFTGAT